MAAPDGPTPPVGTTVTLQVATPVGRIGVVGVLLTATPATWTIRRRDGSVIEVAVDAIEARRTVPPPPAVLATVAEVEQVAALGWRALETARLGEWLLRAGGGFTARANSALALGSPGIPVAAAIDAVQDWYADRVLPAQITFTEPATDIDPATDSEIARVLMTRGWTRTRPTNVMTAEIAHVLRAGAGLADVMTGAQATDAADVHLHIDDAPDDGWLAAFRADGGPLPPIAPAVLTNHPSAAFASARTGAGEVMAIARVAVDGRWAGLSSVEVAPAFRRRHLATTTCMAALRWAGQRGARRTYLQVATRNAAAIAVYEKLNFTIHHRYAYWQAPSAAIG